MIKNNKNTSYLNFDKHRMVNLEYSLDREILITNRRGAYHSTSLSECNTRKQHGLLVVPAPHMGNTNHLLLSAIDETIVQHGAEFNMGINKFDGNNFAPHGHKYIREFSCHKGLKITYRVGGVVFSKEKLFSLKNNTIFIRYTLLDAHSPTIIRFKPLLAFREINALTYENTLANHGYKIENQGISMCMYSGYPDLYMQFNKPDVHFEFDPKWYKGVEYLKDMQEDVPYKEDLYMPGYFELPFVKGESIIFAASDTLVDVNDLEETFEEGLRIRTHRDSFMGCLRNAAHQMIYRPKSGETYLLNGYPWGRVLARELFVSLNGLTLAIEDIGTYEEVINTVLPVIDGFLEGRHIETLLEGIDEPDVLLWFLRSLDKYSAIEPERFNLQYAHIVRKVIDFIMSNKHPRLHLNEDFLLETDGKTQPASWMNGMINGSPVVPRSGLLVEINAKWFNALKFVAKTALKNNDDETYLRLENLADAVKQSFVKTFVNDLGYLYDFVDNGKPDWTVRPNMLCAISSKYQLLDKRTAKLALDYVTRELLTTKGLRTKSPKSGGYAPRYEGSRDEKVYAAFNGVARVWLLEPYIEAYMTVFQKSGLSFLDRILSGIEQEMGNDCIGSLSEMYDGSMPSWGHGLISSGIDIAGVLSSIYLKNKYQEALTKSREEKQLNADVK